MEGKNWIFFYPYYQYLVMLKNSVGFIKMKKKLIEILKALGLFPKSGYGEIVLKVHEFNIVDTKVVTSKKI